MAKEDVSEDNRVNTALQAQRDIISDYQSEIAVFDKKIQTLQKENLVLEGKLSKVEQIVQIMNDSKIEAIKAETSFKDATKQLEEQAQKIDGFEDGNAINRQLDEAQKNIDEYNKLLRESKDSLNKSKNQLAIEKTKLENGEKNLEKLNKQLQDERMQYDEQFANTGWQNSVVVAEKCLAESDFDRHKA